MVLKRMVTKRCSCKTEMSRVVVKTTIVFAGGSLKTILTLLVLVLITVLVLVLPLLS